MIYELTLAALHKAAVKIPISGRTLFFSQNFPKCYEVAPNKENMWYRVVPGGAVVSPVEQVNSWQLRPCFSPYLAAEQYDAAKVNYPYGNVITVKPESKLIKELSKIFVQIGNEPCGQPNFDQALDTPDLYFTGSGWTLNQNAHVPLGLLLGNGSQNNALLITAYSIWTGGSFSEFNAWQLSLCGANRNYAASYGNSEKFGSGASSHGSPSTPIVVQHFAQYMFDGPLSVMDSLRFTAAGATVVPTYAYFKALCSPARRNLMPSHWARIGPLPEFVSPDSSVDCWIIGPSKQPTMSDKVLVACDCNLTAGSWVVSSYALTRAGAKWEIDRVEFTSDAELNLMLLRSPDGIYRVTSDGAVGAAGDQIGIWG